MARVILDRHCKEIDAPSGRRYRAKDGVFTMSDSDARATARMGGAVASTTGTTSSKVGYRCLTCSFGSFFKTCSRCGGECVKDKPVDDPFVAGRDYIVNTYGAVSAIQANG